MMLAKSQRRLCKAYPLPALLRSYLQKAEETNRPGSRGSDMTKIKVAPTYLFATNKSFEISTEKF